MKFAAWACSLRAGLGIWVLFLNFSFAAEWVQGAGHRSALVVPGPGGKAGFTFLAPAITGIAFTNRLEGDMYLTNAVAHNGAGLAIGDFDQDGQADIFFCSLQGPNSLYRNLGDWRFAKVDAGPIACADQLSTGAAFADVDGDGDLDLLVNGIAAGTRLFLNDGKGRWSESINAGLSRTNSATSMALADIDRDGDLDLYCAHYIDVMHLADPTTRFALGRREGKWEVIRVNGQSTRLPKWQGRFEALPDGSVRELPEAHGLYRNDGNGRFTAIQNEAGVFQDSAGKPIAPFRDWGLAVMFRDINHDGAPDLYVCNDNASPDRFWINNGSGTFRAADKSMLRHTSRSSMGLDFADVDRDGRDDFIVVDMLARAHGKRMTQLVRDYPEPNLRERIDEQPRYNRNSLFMGRADGSFSEAAFLAGVAATDWSWCSIFLDVDLVGYEDLLVSNGFSFDVMDQDSHDQLRQKRLAPYEQKRSRQWHPQWRTVLAAFRNQRDGTFLPMAGEWGFSRGSISYGMALGDLDADGDLDLVVNQLNEAPAIYRNDSPAPRVAVRLKGIGANSQGIGARIRLVSSELVQEQEMIAGGRYMSGDEGIRVFAAVGDELRLEVLWPDGKQSVVGSVQANRIYEIDHAKSSPAKVQAKALPKAYFADVSDLLEHQHVESEYDDWSRQALLPRRLSRLGPALSWFDVNNDGLEDLLAGASRGRGLSVFLNQEGKSFAKAYDGKPGAGDLNGVIALSRSGSQPRMIAAISNLEQPPGAQSQIEMIEISNGTLRSAQVNAGAAAIGALTAADIDADGDIDLFAGGRALPGGDPELPRSSIWLNDQNSDGEFKKSDEHSAPFETIGLVSGATFADLDNDGDADLALAMEWGPVRIFLNDSGRFTDATQSSGLSSMTGWWTSIAAGDFDGDGRMDLAAGNWGLNTPYALHAPSPLRAYYGDWNGDGALEMIEAWSDGEQWYPVRNRTWLARGLPELQQRFSTHEAFAQASIIEILAARHEQTRFVEASQFESSVFLNRGSRFERIALPRAAQLSPVFSLNVGDVDGDGTEDLFVGQNFFGSASDLSREDSGQGLWLRGRSDGSFSAMDSTISGIRILGEQRSAALADFNHDARVDLAVSQNNEQTKLYLNKLARPGLRVIVTGPPLNPHAIGARLRLEYKDGTRGPARAIQCGSGYMSQDAAVQVLGLRGPVEAVWIHWPNGKEQSIRVSKENEVRIAWER